MDVSTASAGLHPTPGSGSSRRSNMTASSGQRGSRGESDVDKTPFTGAAVADDELTEEDISVKREAPQIGIWNDEEEDPYVSGGIRGC